MNRADPGEPDNTKVFTLATDLDGTFIGGTRAERDELYDWIDAHRDAVELIFVTGRDLPFIAAACADAEMPWPDYVIGDVGTTIATCDAQRSRIVPDTVLEERIEALWGEGIAPISAALDAAPGLTPQDGPFRYRMSYHYDPNAFDPTIRTIIEGAGFDCLISDDRFLDVLPKGISKGPSLMRLLGRLGTDHAQVLVAGDTLNDLSLFETGLSGVAVGNAEPALMARIETFDNVHFADAHGAAGVLEAIHALGFHETAAKAAKTKKEMMA
ncbi:HAD family hydrolase [Tepidamorphus sp. 3E244]|uniref:HAD family hydrolase n=1 Tax=Tepidamorphus sp. 3E244 TaxID=3385498 RepID=UPI0038FC2753